MDQMLLMLKNVRKNSQNSDLFVGKKKKKMALRVKLQISEYFIKKDANCPVCQNPDLKKEKKCIKNVLVLHTGIK